MKAYLDNGATTKVDPKVLKAMIPYFKEHYGNASSIHVMGLDAKKALEIARKDIASIINALPEEIIFTSGGTESDNLAIYGVLNKFRTDNPGEKAHIITSQIEHPAVLNTCKALEKDGVEVSYISVDEDGMIKIDELKNNIRPHTKLITIMHANNEVGTIQPIEEIARIAQEHKIIFHSDAVQSFTKIKIDVKALGIDLMTFSAHKIHGPKGIGALYVKKGTPLRPMMFGGAHEFKKRPGTENVAGAVGFAAAAKLVKDSDIKKMIRLKKRLVKGLLKIEHSKLNGSMKNGLCNNANVGFAFVEGEGLMMHLSDKGICVSTGSACSSNSLEPSHVLSAMGLRHEIIHGTIRFTLSKYTTVEEIDHTIQAVQEIVVKLREFSPLREGVKYTIIDDGEDHHHDIKND
ncbi:MAG: cysteine desulfurase family protein [Candidatus Woesearchaeota archaeon]